MFGIKGLLPASELYPRFRLLSTQLFHKLGTEQLAIPSELEKWNPKLWQSFKAATDKVEFLDSSLESRYHSFASEDRRPHYVILASSLWAFLFLRLSCGLQAVAKPSSITWGADNNGFSRKFGMTEVTEVAFILCFFTLLTSRRRLSVAKDDALHIFLSVLLHLNVLVRMLPSAKKNPQLSSVFANLATLFHLSLVAVFTTTRFTSAFISSLLIVVLHMWFKFKTVQKVPSLLAIEGVFMSTIWVMMIWGKMKADIRARQLFYILSSSNSMQCSDAGECAGVTTTKEAIRVFADALNRSVPILDSLSIFKEAKITKAVLESAFFKVTGIYGGDFANEVEIGHEVQQLLDFYSGMASKNQISFGQEFDDDDSSMQPSGDSRNGDNATINDNDRYEIVSRYDAASRYDDVSRNEGLSRSDESSRSEAADKGDVSIAYSGEAFKPGKDLAGSEQNATPEDALNNFLAERFHLRGTTDLGCGQFAILDLYLRAHDAGAFLACKEEFLLRANHQEFIPSKADWELPLIFDNLIRSNCSFLPVLEVGFSYLQPFMGGFLRNNPAGLADFLIGIQHCYLDNPYHNSFHAAQVAHSSMWLVDSITLGARLSRLDRLSLVLACLGHDVGHPARTNGSMISLQNQLALLFNDSAVLENYHSALLFQLIRKFHSELFNTMTRSDFFELRRTIINCVLSTDMADHFEVINRWKVRFIAGDFSPHDTDKSIFLQMVIKAGDLSHAALNWNWHVVWSSRVRDELVDQGREEARAGLPISPLCDKRLWESSSYAKNQIGFLTMIVTPLFSELAKVELENQLREECMRSITTNINEWERERDLAANLSR